MLITSKDGRVLNSKEFLYRLCGIVAVYSKREKGGIEKFVPISYIREINEKQVEWEILRKALWFLIQHNCLELRKFKGEYYVRVAERGRDVYANVH
jgi:hypothetical protein